MMVSRCFILPLLLAPLFAGAVPLERDLGQGLGYVRLQRLPADLPASEAGRAKARVLDTRYAEADADAATAFVAWLKFRAAPRAPLFVLVNGGTSPALLAALTTRHSGSPASPNFLTFT